MDIALEASLRGGSLATAATLHQVIPLAAVVGGGPAAVGAELHIGSEGPRAIQVHWLVEFVGTDYRFWSGAGDLTYGDRTYRGRGGLIELAGAETDIESPDRRITARVAIVNDELRTALMQDPSPLTVAIEWLYSWDHGHSWQRVPRRFVGRLSRPVIKDATYTIEVETHGDDIDRGRPLRWSHEDQQTRYPGDKGLEYMRELASGLEAAWPP